MSDLDDMLEAAGMLGEDGTPVDPSSFRSGFVTLVGRPNAGKSTLINAVMGRKVAITSDTPQTTRHRFRAVYDRDDMQMILVDTPGLHKPQDELNAALDASALKALSDVDVVADLIDCTQPIGKGDEWVADQIRDLPSAKICVISKADIGSQEEVDAQMERAKELADFDEMVVVSAKEGFNVEGFIEAVYEHLPCGPRWFPEGTGVDISDEVLVAEFVREKILDHTHDEIPHSVGVVTEEIDYDEARNFRSIRAIIYVERESQAGVIVGKGGSMIKQIGTEARVDLERFFGGRIHLDLSVKVKKNWRRDAAQIQRFGYGEGL